MTESRELMVAPAGQALPLAGAQPPAEQELPIRKLQRLLRGRYLLTAAVALAAAGICAAVGWYTGPKVYRSTGLIQIKAYLPRILYQSEQSGVLPAFDSYLAAQESLIRSRRVIDIAMASADWKGLNRGLSDEEIGTFVGSMDVGRKGELIQVSFTDESPQAAMLGVKAIVEAYERLYNEQDTESQAGRLRVLQDRRNTLTSEIAGLRERIFGIANEFGSDGLQKIYQFKLDELHKVESRLREIDLGIALAKGQRGQVPVTTQPELTTLEDLVQRHPHYRPLLDRRNALEAQITQLRGHYGDNHRSVKEVRLDLDALADQIEKVLQAHRRGGEVPAVFEARPGEAVGLSLEQLEAQQKQLRQLYEQLQREALDLGRKSLQIDNLKGDIAAADQRLEETKARLDQLNVESVFSGRLQVISKGERPVAPASDKRRQRAILGAGAGGMAGFLAVVLIALLNRTVRHADDAQRSIGTTRMLGVLPHLPDDLADQAQATLAAHCVHHIRTMLQIGARPGEDGVFAISSATAGAGKTSLTLALGLSFAESGARVLLVDGDVVGGGLTRRLGAIVRQRLGRILVDQGRLTPEQLAEALARSRASGQRLGEALLGMNLVDHESLRTALDLQATDHLGLMEALGAGDIHGFAADTGIPLLSILPQGRASETDCSRLSPTSVNRLLASARRAFDVVLVDTGPLLGTVDTTVLTAAASQVVLVVARGDQKSEVEQAVQRLQSFRGRLAGFVFNRADHDELRRSVYSGSSQRRSRRGPNGHPVASAFVPAASDPGQAARPADDRPATPD